MFTKSMGPTLLQSSVAKLHLLNVFTPTYGGVLELEIQNIEFILVCIKSVIVQITELVP